MLEILQRLFAMLGLVIAGYALIFKNYELINYMGFALGAMILVLGLNQIKKDQRKSGIFSILVSIFIFVNTIIILRN